jgi:hypothetical protein
MGGRIKATHHDPSPRTTSLTKKWREPPQSSRSSRVLRSRDEMTQSRLVSSRNLDRDRPLGFCLFQDTYDIFSATTTHNQGMLPVLDPRPSTRVLGQVLGSLKYPTTYSSNVEFSTLVPVTYLLKRAIRSYLPTWYLPEYLSRPLLTTRYLPAHPSLTRVWYGSLRHPKLGVICVQLSQK